MTEQPPQVRAPRPPNTPLPTIVLARDLTPAAVRAAVRTGELERIRPGAFRRVPPAAEPAASATNATKAAAARELALARMAAIGKQLSTQFWFSCESAALVWGCPLWTVPVSTHIIQTMRPHGKGDPDLRRHHMTLDAADRTQFRGVPVTSLDRTVVDCLRALAPRDALVVADGALRLGADRDAIAARLSSLTRGRGVVAARTVLDFADGRAESPWETFVRYTVVRSGLPRPELQIPIRTRLGWFRADMGWSEWKLLLEFDGFSKYSGDADPARVLFEEKRRQEAIEEEDWTFIRVTAGDMSRPDDLLGRVCRRLPPELVATLRPIAALTPR